MDQEPVYSVTSARSGQHDELGGRERRYFISMAIRALCFLGGVVAWQMVGPWLGAILFVGAVFLPYTSVVLANAGTRTQASGTQLVKNPPGTIERRDDEA